MTIWLASYPRSGNTFFRILLNQVYDLKTYSLYDDDLFTKSENLHQFSKVIGYNQLPSWSEMASSTQPFIIKTHYLPFDEHPAIYLVRDGRDVLVSYAHYILSFSDSRSGWKTKAHKLLSLIGFNQYNRVLKNLIINGPNGGWSQHVDQWNQRSNTVTLKFEDLVKNPVEQVEKSLQIIGLPKLSQESQNKDFTFSELHSKYPMSLNCINQDSY